MVMSAMVNVFSLGERWYVLLDLHRWIEHSILHLMNLSYR